MNRLVYNGCPMLKPELFVRINLMLREAEYSCDSLFWLIWVRVIFLGGAVNFGEENYLLRRNSCVPTAFNIYWYKRSFIICSEFIFGKGGKKKPYCTS